MYVSAAIHAQSAGGSSMMRWEVSSAYCMISNTKPQLKGPHCIQVLQKLRLFSLMDFVSRGHRHLCRSPAKLSRKPCLYFFTTQALLLIIYMKMCDWLYSSTRRQVCTVMAQRNATKQSVHSRGTSNCTVLVLNVKQDLFKGWNQMLTGSGCADIKA